MSPSRALFWFCLSFIIGIFCESLYSFSFVFVWILFIGNIFLAVFSLLLGKDRIATLSICFIFLVLGISRVQIAKYQMITDEFKNTSGSSVTIEGVIIDKPILKENVQNLKVKVGKSVLWVVTGRYPEYQFFDKIKISGQIENPKDTGSFSYSYKNYLLKEGIYSIVYFPKIELVGKAPHQLVPFIYYQILRIKEIFQMSLRKIYSPLYSSFLEAILLGERADLSKELREKIQTAGLAHVLAVSGLHVTTIVAILNSFFLFLGLSRRGTFYFLIFFIVFYVALVGFPASALRAGTMAGVAILAQKFYRQASSSRALIFAATLLLFANPWFLVYDLGFQLSFLAVSGLIYLEPVLRTQITSFLKKILKRELPEQFQAFLSIFSGSLAVSFFTFPILIYSFGKFSLASLVTNLLILPFLPFTILLGFFSAFVGIFSQPLGWLFSFPAYFLMIYTFLVVEIFSSPYFLFTFVNLHWIWVIFYYLLLAFLTRYFYKKINFLF